MKGGLRSTENRQFNEKTFYELVFRKTGTRGDRGKGRLRTNRVFQPKNWRENYWKETFTSSAERKKRGKMAFNQRNG